MAVWDLLPPELLERILSLLPLPALQCAVLVSRDWASVGTRPALWQHWPLRLPRPALATRPAFPSASRYSRTHTARIGRNSKLLKLENNLHQPKIILPQRTVGGAG